MIRTNILSLPLSLYIYISLTLPFFVRTLFLSLALALSLSLTIKHLIFWFSQIDVLLSFSLHPSQTLSLSNFISILPLVQVVLHVKVQQIGYVGCGTGELQV